MGRDRSTHTFGGEIRRFDPRDHRRFVTGRSGDGDGPLGEVRVRVELVERGIAQHGESSFERGKTRVPVRSMEEVDRVRGPTAGNEPVGLRQQIVGHVRDASIRGVRHGCRSS